jgi:hypothetical protein
MEITRMNGPKQVRFIYHILKEGLGNQYKDSELIEYASSLHELFHDENDGGYDYQPSYDEPNIKDVFSLMSSYEGELMYQERELLNLVYEFESNEFITNKPWKIDFGGRYEC